VENKKRETLADEKARKNAAKKLKEKLDSKKEQIHLLDGTIEETIESLKSDYIEILNEQATAKNELLYLNQQLEQQKKKGERLDQENEKYINEREEINGELSAIQDELTFVNEMLN